MSKLQSISDELEQISTINKLSGAFESIASMQIARVKQQVLTSKGFFEDLWQLYTKLRTTDEVVFGAQATETKELFIVITAEGGFSGDIDQKLIDWVLNSFDKNKHEIIVIGHHGAIQLAQRGVSIKRYYKLPTDDEHIEVSPIIQEVIRYPNTTAYYQTYVSLSIQDIKKLSLQTAVKQLGANIEEEDVISSSTYIFEPSVEEVLSYLESTMLGVALSQIILESKLAQYASRFKAMSAAHDRARESKKDLQLQYNRSKRAMADNRLKEIINAMRLNGAHR